MNLFKRCPKCNTEKQATDFYADKNGKPKGYCKPCNAEKTALWKAQHAERKREMDNEWMRQHRAKQRAIKIAQKEANRLAGIVERNANFGRRHKPRNPGFPEGTLVDEQDFHLSKYSWYLKSDGYVVRSITLPDGKRRQISLHREIMGFPEGLEVDHKNGVKIDCRRDNLRVVDRRTNNQNQRLSRNSKTGMLGVKVTRYGKYQAFAKWDGHDVYLGTFDTADHAAEVAQKFREQFYEGYTGRDT